MRRLFLGILAAALLALPGQAAGQMPQDQFELGNTAYAEGDYEGAISHYRAILDSGLTNSNLYYNLGNAYIKAGQKGRGIVHYERALRIDPLDSQTRENLEWVRLRLEDKITARGVSWIARQFKGFLNLLSLRGALRTVLTLNVLFFGFAILALFKTGARKRFKPFLWITGLVFVLTVSLAGVQAARAKVKDGVIVAPEVKVRFAPLGKGQVAFTLHDGASCEIRAKVFSWVRVRLADGKSGWLEEKDIEEI